MGPDILFYPTELGRVIYTTIIVEALHCAVRKTTKTKRVFVNDQALEKQL